MEPNNWAHLNFWLNLVSLLILPIGYTIWKTLIRIRENDLKHIDTQFENLRVDLKKINDKLDLHIQWHLEDHA